MGKACRVPSKVVNICFSVQLGGDAAKRLVSNSSDIGTMQRETSDGRALSRDQVLINHPTAERTCIGNLFVAGKRGSR